MHTFFAELKRRHIYRVAAAYAVVAWVLIQLVNNLTPMLLLPNWTGSLVFVLLLVGFPVALIFAWIHELQPATAGGPLGPVTTGKLDWALIATLGMVIAIFAYQQFVPGSTSRTKVVQGAAVTAAREASASPKGAISLAVLPFANMSGDPNQEFFSDGMTEEITAALSKVPDLRVVARTSAFEFKGQNRNIKTVGDELGASHLIEGSVRKSGERVRITVQLVKTDDGTHIWSENYDRDLTDIFAVQEEIARAITASLRMPLGLKPGENLVNNRNIDSESYQQYLRASALVQARGRARAIEAAQLLEKVVARNPNYAPAWVTLGAAYYFVVNTDPARTIGTGNEFRQVVDAYLPKIEAAARRASQLDPNYAGGYGGLGIIQLERGNLLSAEELWAKAFTLDPYDPRSLHGHSLALAIPGRIKEANAVRQQLQAVEPFVPIYNRFTALYLWVDGQNDAALAILNALPPDAANRMVDIAMIYASIGRYREAADMLENGPPGNATPQTLKDAARLLRSAPAHVVAPQSLPRLGLLDWVYLYVGAPDRALERREYEVKSGFAGAAVLPLIWHPSYAPVRKTERFKAYVREIGLVDYWRAKGWPDLCRPVGPDDFACD